MDAEIKDWSCKRCTLENPGDLSICQACGGSKLRSLENGGGGTMNAKSWTCPKCTLKNPIAAQKCRVCETSRGKIPRKIKCSACTYENSAGAKKCEMCNSAMNTQKVVVNNPQPPPIQHETTRPGSTTSMGSRHESELMEQLRKVEESAAKDKWRNIVQFCKEVLMRSLNILIIFLVLQGLRYNAGELGHLCLPFS